MGNMYSKLGNMLNEALENGEIPQKNTNSANEKENDYRNIDEKADKTTANLEKEKVEVEKKSKRIHFFTQKSQFVRGEVIKMHKYTKDMHISPEILYALGTLDIAYPVSWKVIQRQYHKLLKELHPDTKTTIQDSNRLQNNTNRTIQDIQNAYNLLKTLYKK